MPESLDELKEKAAARVFLRKLKTAGPKLDMAKTVAKDVGGALLRNKDKLIAGGLGAVGAGALGYSMAKPGKDGAPSTEQLVGQKLTDSAANAKKLQDEAGVQPTFKQGLVHAVAPGVKGVADLLAKHPGKAALMAAPAGALAGLRILKTLK